MKINAFCSLNCIQGISSYFSLIVFLFLIANSKCDIDKNSQINTNNQKKNLNDDYIQKRHNYKFEKNELIKYKLVAYFIKCFFLS